MWLDYFIKHEIRISSFRQPGILMESIRGFFFRGSVGLDCNFLPEKTEQYGGTQLNRSGLVILWVFC